MAKTIKLKYEDVEYKLEYTRQSLVEMRRKGFKTDMLSDDPLVGIPMLFKGAFLANHKKLGANKIDEIYDNIRNKEEFVGLLAEMYAEPIQSLLGESDSGKAEWEKSW